MAASCSFRSCVVAPRRAAFVRAPVASATLTTATGCTAPHRDRAPALVPVSGELLADGSCRVLVHGAPLFATADAPRTAYDAGPVADVAPAGYTLRQLACAPAGADPALRSSGADARLLLVTLYAREGAPLRVGRYTVRAALTAAEDSAGAASRAGVAVFGAPMPSPRAGVSYLEGRAGTLTITSASPDADGIRVVGTFNVLAERAWSM